ncbi:MAG: LLM class flavin-dependent oxidoreductase [Betaproteobacteria bacterium]|nr:LLM class flavin-dependent oxidoreductase [Betaproteobacteria bacterium]
MHSIGIAFDGRNPLPVAREQARAAEAIGASTLWVSSHLFLRDPFSTAAVLLDAVPTARVALMAVSPQVMHPVHIAMAAATLEELAPGRVVLCIGTGSPGDLADAGVEPRRPVRMLAETVEAVRLLLSGKPATYEGELIRLRGRRMAKAASMVPIFLAASHPRTLELAGRVADGIVLSTASSVEFVRWSLEHVERGEQRRRRIARAGLVYAFAAERTADTLGRFRRQLAITLRAPHHAKNLSLAGARLDQAAVREALAREDWAAAEALVSDDTVRRHTACGTPEELRARLDAYRTAGLDEIVLAGLYTPEETRRTGAAAFGKDA